MLTGAWAAGRVSAMQPEFGFEVHPLPVLEDGSLLVINPDTKLSVNAGSGHIDAAMKFVEYFTGRKIYKNLQISSLHSIRCRGQIRHRRRRSCRWCPVTEAGVR